MNFVCLLLISRCLIHCAKLRDLNETKANEIQNFGIPPVTVKTLNLTAFLGRWYQGYASLIPNETFERNGYCITADYFEPTLISKKNHQVVSILLVNSLRYFVTLHI